MRETDKYMGPADAINAAFDRIEAIETHGARHLREIKAELAALNGELARSVEQLGVRLVALEAKQPQEPPSPNELVMALLEYTNGKFYYSVIYHDGQRWRRQGGGSLAPYSFEKFRHSIGVSVKSWKKVELPS